MSTNQLQRDLWLVNLLRTYGRMTRAEINQYWCQSKLSNGTEIPRRTFYNIREEIENVFGICMGFDPRTNEYFLEEDEHSRALTSWMVHTQAMNDIFTNSRDVSHLIFLEDIPSARSYLQLLVEALKAGQRIKFDYAPYTRSTPSRDVVIEPYFLKLFKQRWYVTGRVVKDGNTIKTYALDRMLNATISSEKYEIPESFDAETYFKDSFGVVFTQGEVKDIMIKVDARQAKYFRAVPLHPSQQEMIHDTHSIFTYKMKISPDFVEEILSHGSRVTVLQPPELRAMVVTELSNALAAYPQSTTQ